MSFKTARQEDTKVFLNEEEFGTEAVYKGTNIVINIQEEEDVNTGEIYHIGLVSILDTPNLKENDSFVVGSETYNVIALFPLLPTDVFRTVRLTR